MKKKILISLSALLLISTITTGCGKTAEVKNGAKVAVSTNEEKITATEYYDEIKKDSISKLINMIDKGILEKKYKSDDKDFGVSSEDELEDMLRLEYKRNEAVKDYIKKNIKDDEIKKYYEENIYGEVKASQILISSSAKSNATDDEKAKAEEKAKKKAEEIIKKLNKGEDFAKLAKKYSDDDATKSNGGDLGYFDLSDMEETFGNAVKKLKVNEYTKDPVKTTYGYHIVLKTGEKDKPKLNKVKSKIKDKLTDEKINSSNTIYYETLMNIREDEKIKWNDDSLKKAYEDYMNNLIKQANSSTTSTNN